VILNGSSGLPDLRRTQLQTPTVKAPRPEASRSEEAPPAPLETFTPSTPATALTASKPLTRAQRKKLIKAHSQAATQAAQMTAVVIGGGPGGLSAAITLSRLGYQVTVLEARANETGEKPAHARPHQISLRQDALETLKELGAYDEVIARSGFVQKEVHIESDGTNSTVREKVPEGLAKGQDPRGLIHPTLLHTDSVSQVRISDVEKALYNQSVKLAAEAAEHGIEIKSGVKADLAKVEGSSSYEVLVRDVVKDGDGYQPTGPSTSLGVPDLVVAADGAGSPTRAALGINILEESKPKNYLGGHIQKGIGAQTRKATLSETDGLRRHLMATGHAQYDATWVSVEITPEEAALPVEERKKLLADKAQVVMMQDVKVDDIGWGAGQVTTVQNRRAEKTTAGDNLVLLGDAAGTGSVWVGGGLNLALTTHLSALSSLATRFRDGSDKEMAMKIYDRTIQWATSTWHKAGAAELGGPPAA
jgi:2-polyprenyl-6-methoxyphenol hydroxylase-like FAD-dependent oxidoreductase